MNNVDHMKQLIQLVESAEQLTEVNIANLIKAAALAGSIAVGSQSIGATDVNTADKPEATRQYSIVNQQADDIISRYHPEAGRKNITGMLAPHKILDNTAEGKLLSDIKTQMHQRWNTRNDPELRQSLRKYVEQQGLVYFVFHLMDTNPEHPFVADVTEY